MREGDVDGLFKVSGWGFDEVESPKGGRISIPAGAVSLKSHLLSPGVTSPLRKRA